MDLQSDKETGKTLRYKSKNKAIGNPTLEIGRHATYICLNSNEYEYHMPITDIDQKFDLASKHESFAIEGEFSLNNEKLGGALLSELAQYPHFIKYNIHGKDIIYNVRIKKLDNF